MAGFTYLSQPAPGWQPIPTVEDPVLIGLVGRKRSGKSSIGSHLTSEHGFVELAFAASLKERALELDPMIGVVGMSLDALVTHVGWDVAKAIPEVRKFLQGLGQTLREVDPDYWVNDLRFALAGTLDDGHNVVVTDVRHQNELDLIKSLDGVLVKVTRPGLDALTDTHVSETSVDGLECDFEVENSGTLEDLRYGIDEFLEGLEAGA